MSKKRFVTWSELTRRCHLLASTIAADGNRNVHLTAIARGGWIPARLIGGYLEQEGVKVEYSTVHAASYDHKNEQASVVEIQSPFYIPPADQAWWLVDDLVDTGLTAQTLLDLAEKENRTPLPSICVVFFKTGSLVVPDAYGEITSADEWIVFPYETEAFE